ncbi:hypothetical protein ACQEVB_39015 [Pseudonocardia sp. CA-107938]|uniref:hypothetical protein n=1 Tax=Pseudonocardia sp. CA-107938 TaxID=3240021 RepID=UPI003D89E5E3
MRIELSDEDAAALREVLTDRLGDLSTEIAGTDNPAFRRALRERRDLIVRVRDSLAAATADR